MIKSNCHDLSYHLLNIYYSPDLYDEYNTLTYDHLYVGIAVDNLVTSSSFHLAVIVLSWVKKFTPDLP